MILAVILALLMPCEVAPPHKVVVQWVPPLAIYSYVQSPLLYGSWTTQMNVSYVVPGHYWVDPDAQLFEFVSIDF